MPETHDTRDYDRQMEFLSALGVAFVMDGHIRRKAVIGNLSDDEARRQLQGANATMARLRQPSIANGAAEEPCNAT